MEIRELRPEDTDEAAAIWNEVVRAGRAVPQREPLATQEEARAFFDAQTRTAVAVERDHVRGLSILHPNNVGRCAHIANASYAVAEDARGRGVGRALVTDSLDRLRAAVLRVCNSMPWWPTMPPPSRSMRIWALCAWAPSPRASWMQMAPIRISISSITQPRPPDTLSVRSAKARRSE